MPNGYTREFNSGSTYPVDFDDRSSNPNPALAKWLQVIGAGTVVVQNEDGSTGTFVCGGGEVIPGTFRRLTSIGLCTSVRAGSGTPPAPLSGGSVATTGTTGAVELSVAPASAAVPIAAGINDPSITNAALAVFGDGSDGALVFDGTSVVLSITPSANVYTLARDIFASSITVAAGVSVYAAGFRVFCQGTCTIAATGSINNDGKAAVTSTAGAITNASGSLGVGTAGGAGGAGNSAGSAGTANASGFPGATGIGGAGGGDGTHTAAAAGAWTALAAVKGGARHLLSLLSGFIFGTQTSGTASLVSLICGGTGGGGGGGDNADATGGGGGGGGGVLVVAAQGLVNNGSITATGGAGAAGTSATHNAGGGGGGGGGVVIVVYGSTTGSGTVTAAGGAAGAKAGASGVAGSAGTAGIVVQAAA